MKTLKELREEVLRYFDLADEANTSTDVKLVNAALNTANQHRASEDSWKFMLSAPHTLSVVSGQSSYILPWTDIHHVNYLWSVTKERFLEELPVRQAPFEATFTNVIDPTYNCELVHGGSVVQAQPASFDRLELSSTASEATGVGLYVEGEDVDGAQVSETILPDGVSTYEYVKVTYYAKTGVWTGTLTLSTQGGDTLLTLSAEQDGKEYTLLRFFAPPTGAETISYRYFRQPRTLTRDGDRPDIPFPLSNILVYDVLLDMATYNELDSESVNVWRQKQESWQMNLYATKLEADTINGAPMMINEGRRW